MPIPAFVPTLTVNDGAEVVSGVDVLVAIVVEVVVTEVLVVVWVGRYEVVV